MNYQPSAEEVRAGIEEKLSRHFGCTHTEASRDQMYKAAAMTVKEILTEKTFSDERRSVRGTLRKGVCLSYIRQRRVIC